MLGEGEKIISPCRKVISMVEDSFPVQCSGVGPENGSRLYFNSRVDNPFGSPVLCGLALRIPLICLSLFTDQRDSKISKYEQRWEYSRPWKQQPRRPRLGSFELSISCRTDHKGSPIMLFKLSDRSSHGICQWTPRSEKSFIYIPGSLGSDRANRMFIDRTHLTRLRSPVAL